MTRSYLRLRARPGKYAPDELLLTFSWASAGHYARWRVSGWRQALLRAIDGLLAEDPVSSRYRLVDAIG